MNVADKVIIALKSSVVWFNALALAALPFFEYLQQSLPLIQQYVDATIYRTVGLIVVVVNIFLGYKSSKKAATDA